MDPAAVTLREQLAKISIKLNIQRIDLGVWINNFRSKQMGLTFNDWATQPDPSLLFYRHFHMAPKGADFRNWKNEAASKLLDEGRAESDLSKRKEIYFRFQKELAAQVPTIMLFSADLITVRGDRTTGWLEPSSHSKRRTGLGNPGPASVSASAESRNQWFAILQEDCSLRLSPLCSHRSSSSCSCAMCLAMSWHR
jgi:ABC-type transport system substrate-binding protein